AIAALSVFVKGKDTSLIEPFTSLLSGNPFYHMWYMYTLIVVYIFIPVIIMVKNEIGEKNFAKASWIFLIVSCISGWTSSFAIEWSISKAVCYIGFILTGYQLRRILMDRKNNILGIVCIFTGICLLLILSYIQYTHSIRGISEAAETYSITGNFNPLVVLASLSIFAGFSMMNIQTEKFNSLSAKTFYIYLIHAAIWDTLARIITKLDEKGIACTIIIPCGIIITFIATYICTILYMKIEKLFQKA
ncbi:MAG: acyltransferase family protein, partial [Lachnospiraceae bacterium]|nr:acyltransferase family protein [Lachnospiraceae bacterium]